MTLIVDCKLGQRYTLWNVTEFTMNGDILVIKHSDREDTIFASNYVSTIKQRG